MAFNQEVFEKNYHWMIENRFVSVDAHAGFMGGTRNLYYHDICKQVFYIDIVKPIESAIRHHVEDCE